MEARDKFIALAKDILHNPSNMSDEEWLEIADFAIEVVSSYLAFNVDWGVAWENENIKGALLDTICGYACFQMSSKYVEIPEVKNLKLPYANIRALKDKWQKEGEQFCEFAEKKLAMLRVYVTKGSPGATVSLPFGRHIARPIVSRWWYRQF